MDVVEHAEDVAAAGAEARLATRCVVSAAMARIMSGIVTPTRTR